MTPHAAKQICTIWPDCDCPTEIDCQAMSFAAPAPRDFHCPRWPGCQCPDDTVAQDCPGRTIEQMPLGKLHRPIAAHTNPASSGSGGPARATPMASPPRASAQFRKSGAIDPDGAVTDFRQQIGRIGGHAASLKARAEKLMAEMRASLQKADDTLWMIRAELAHRADLVDSITTAHMELAMAQRDLRHLVEEL